MNETYEFNITICGSGSSLDEAFEDALNKLKEDASEAITQEVVYTRKIKVDKEEKFTTDN